MLKNGGEISNNAGFRKFSKKILRSLIPPPPALCQALPPPRPLQHLPRGGAALTGTGDEGPLQPIRPEAGAVEPKTTGAKRLHHNAETNACCSGLLTRAERAWAPVWPQNPFVAGKPIAAGDQSPERTPHDRQGRPGHERRVKRRAAP